jgi:UTP--glucose-1-phosphate uridylyltransferase
MSADGLRASVEKMEAEGVPEAAIRTFRHYYEQLESGETGMLPESEIEPVDDVASFEELPDEDGPLDRAVVLKLNGGLGTSMGMTRAKSLIEAKDGLTFLDVIARQVLSLRERAGAPVPLVLMNSFHTRDESLEALSRYDELSSDVPADFVQHKEPKLLVDSLQPVSWEADPSAEWCPPGHGDLYTALLTSGMLDSLLDGGLRYAFISNSDNLAAVLEPRVLAWMAREEIPFVMEVTDRTEADRKGGHIARRGDGYVLRETAQTPDEDLDALQDIGRHRYVNTNNLWVDLRALRGLLEEREGVLGLPLIVNRKNVDPGDKSSPEVFQLETAMGAAVGVFDGARPLRVPRTRFSPVKTTEDLLALRSDAYVLHSDDARVELDSRRDGTPPVIDLDDGYFKRLADFDERFSSGAPSLVECERLAVEGDVAFGRDVVVRGSVTVRAEGDGQRHIEDGAVLEG